MVVTVGNQSCSNISVAAVDTLTAFTCIAPPSLGGGDVRLSVAVDGAGPAAATPLPYDPPHVTSVTPLLCPSNTSCPVTITGSNLGLRTSDAASAPVVHIGALHATVAVVMVVRKPWRLLQPCNPNACSCDSCYKTHNDS